MNTDPIADMLTRIRNANLVGHSTIQLPSSKLKVQLAKVLLAEGYISSYEEFEIDKFKYLKIALKYTKQNMPVVTGLKRVSKPGLRVYAGKDEMPKVLGGLGIAIVSTSKGVMTDKEARKNQVGGEVLAYIW